MIFLKKIKNLINMFYYTGSENQRFLAWIKAKPDMFILSKKYKRLKMKK